MYPVPLPMACLRALAELDLQLAEGVRDAACPHCEGPLHSAYFQRKPRGADVPEELAVRRGLCCGHCRGRQLPPSVLFHGRRVYLKAVVLMAVAARQPDRIEVTARRLAELFGVTRRTVARWLRAYGEGVGRHPAWQRIRGQVPPAVRDHEVPRALLEVLVAHQGLERALQTACRWVPAL
jgi:hypothetical protein